MNSPQRSSVLRRRRDGYGPTRAGSVQGQLQVSAAPAGWHWQLPALHSLEMESCKGLFSSQHKNSPLTHQLVQGVCRHGMHGYNCWCWGCGPASLTSLGFVARRRLCKISWKSRSESVEGLKSLIFWKFLFIYLFIYFSFGYWYWHLLLI